MTHHVMQSLNTAIPRCTGHQPRPHLNSTSVELAGEFGGRLAHSSLDLNSSSATQNRSKEIQFVSIPRQVLLLFLLSYRKGMFTSVFIFTPSSDGNLIETVESHFSSRSYPHFLRCCAAETTGPAGFLLRTCRVAAFLC